MAGPGGREVGRVSIRVVPDTSLFGKDLKQQLERIEKKLRLEIPVVANTRGLEAEVKRAAKRAELAARIDLPVHADWVGADRQISHAARDRTARIDVKVGRAGLNALKGLLGLMGGVGHGPIKLATSLPGLVVLAGLVSIATQLVGVVALLPALLLSAGAAAGVLAFAFVGLTSSSVPAVKDMLAAFKEMAPAVKKLQEAIRTKLFANMGREIRALAKVWLPLLERTLVPIAASFNAITVAFTEAFRTPQTLLDSENGLIALRRAFDNLVPAVRPFVEAMRDIALVGASFLPTLATSLANATQSFADFIAKARDDGSLARFLQRGIEATQMLASGLLSITRILVGIGEAAAKVGIPQALVGFLKAIADFVNSPGGQAKIQAIFQTIKDAVEKATPGLQAVAGAFSAISEALKPAVIAAAKSFSDAMLILGPAVEKAAPFVGQVITWLLTEDLALTILAVAAAWKVYGAGVAFAGAMSTLAAGPVGLLVLTALGLLAAFTFLVIKFPEVEAAFGKFVSAFTDTFERWKGYMETAIEKVKGIWNGLVSWFKGESSGSPFYNPGEILGKVGRAIVDGFIAGITYKNKGIYDAFFAILAIPGQVFAKPGDILYKVGQQIINGLIGGLGSKIEPLKKIVKEIGDLVSEGLAKLWQLRSPSKVMFRIGGYAGEGLALGLESKTKRIERAAGQMTVGMRNMLGQSAGGGFTIQGGVNIHNPMPERASQSIPAALRLAAYEMGY